MALCHCIPLHVWPVEGSTSFPILAFKRPCTCRLSPVQIVHARQRKADVEENAEEVKGVFRTLVMCNSLGQAAHIVETVLVALVGFASRVKAGITNTISSRRPRQQEVGKDAAPEKKQDGFRIGTLTIGGKGGIRRTDPNTVSLFSCWHWMVFDSAHTAILSSQKVCHALYLHSIIDRVPRDICALRPNNQAHTGIWQQADHAGVFHN